MNTEARLSRNPEVTSSLLPDGVVVLMCEKTNWAHTLSPLAAVVWEFCDGNNSTEQIIEQMRAIEEISAVTNLREQVVALVQDLLNDALLESLDDHEDELPLQVSRTA